MLANVSAGADRKANTRGGGALERGHGATLEALAQLGDALGGVGAVAATIDAAELVAEQAASKGGCGGGCQRGLIRERVLRCTATHSSEVTALPVSPSHSLVMPSVV